MISELAEDYSSFLNVDLTKRLSGSTEVVDDMLTRLEEFQGLIQLVQSDSLPSVSSVTEGVLAHKGELQQMCERIDGLECLVLRVKRDMDSIESLLSSLEAESGSTEGVLLKTLGALFSKPAIDVSQSAHSPFCPPDVFSSDMAFQNPEPSYVSSSSD